MVLRLRGAKAELESAGLETDGMATSVSNLREQIKGLTGFDIMKDATTYKPVYEQLSGIAEAIKNMDSNSSNVTALMELLTGKRGINVGTSMLKNWDMVASATKSAENSAGSADKEYDRWLQSVEGHISVVQSKFQDLSQTLLKSGLIKFVMDLAEGFLDVSKSVGALTPLLTVLGTMSFNKGSMGVHFGLNGDGGFNASFFGLGNGNKYSRIQDSINAITGNGTWTRPGFNGNEYIPAHYDGAPTLFSEMIYAREAMKEFKANTLGMGIQGNVNLSTLSDENREQFLRLQNNINTTTAAYTEQAKVLTEGNKVAEAYTNNMNLQKGPLTNLRRETASLTLKTIGLNIAQTALNATASLVIGFAISGLIEGITSYINRSQDALEATEENIEAYKNLKDSIQEARNFGNKANGEATEELEKFIRIQKQLKESPNGQINVDNEDLTEYYKTGNKIAELVPELVTGWDKNNNAILQNIDSLDTYNKKLDEAVKKANQKLVYDDISEGESKSQVSLEGGKFDDSYEDYKAAEMLRDILPGGINNQKYKDYVKKTRDFDDTVDIYKQYDLLVDFIKEELNLDAGAFSNIYGGGDFSDVMGKAVSAAGITGKITDENAKDVRKQLNINAEAYKSDADAIAKNRATILKAKRQSSDDNDNYLQYSDEVVALIEQFYDTLDSDFFVDQTTGDVKTEEQQVRDAKEVEEKINELVKTDAYKNFNKNKNNASASNYKSLEDSLFDAIKNISNDANVQKALGAQFGLNIKITEDGQAQLINDLETVKSEFKSNLEGFVDKDILNAFLGDLGNLSQSDLSQFKDIPEEIFEEIKVWLQENKGREDLSKAFSDYLTSAVKASKIQQDAKRNIVDQIKAISTYTDVAGAVLKEQSDSGGVSSDSVVKLYDAFKELDGFDISNFVEETTDGFVLVENASTYLKDIIISNKKDELKTLQDHAIKFLNIQDIEATGTEEATNRIIASYQNRLDLLLSSGLNTNEKKLEALQLKKIINDLEGKTKDTSKTESLIDKLLNEAQNGNAKDKVLSQWEKFYAELKHKRQMDLISEEEYYRQLNKGMNMYLTGNDENTVKQRRQVQEELHDYEIKAWDRALQKQQRSLDTGKITNSQYYRWITRNADKYLARVKGNADKEAEIRKALYDAQKSLDDQYYEKKNKQQDGVLKAVDSLFDDEIKTLNKTKDSIKKAYDQEIEAINDKIEVMDEENNQRQRALDLAKAEEELAKAQRNRNRRVYKAGVGFVYEQDQSAIADAQKGLSDVRVNNAKAELEDEKKTLQKQSDTATQYYSDMIDSLEEYKSAWDDVPKEFEKATNQMVLSTTLGIHNLTEVLKGGTSVLKEFQSLYDNTHIGELIKNLKYGDETYSMSDINYIEALAKQMNVDTTGIKTSGVTAQQSLTNAMSILAGGNKIPSSIQMSFGDIVISSPVGDGKSLADAIKSQFPNYMTQLMSRNY